MIYNKSKVMKRFRNPNKLYAPSRYGRVAKSIAALALALSACSNGTSNSSAYTFPNTSSQTEYDPAVSKYAKYYGADLLSARWERAENITVGDHILKVYKEKGQQSTAETTQRLIKAANNSLLVKDAVGESLQSIASPQDQQNRSLPQPAHVFFIFGSEYSMQRADPNALYGPITGSKSNMQGEVVENMTMLAPYPFSAYMLNSSLNDRIFQEQQAVCVNMLDSISATGADVLNPADALSSQKQTQERAKSEMMNKSALCGNIALAATIKSGSDMVEHLGGAYTYYSALSDAVRRDNELNGQTLPSMKLSPEAFEKIVV